MTKHQNVSDARYACVQDFLDAMALEPRNKANHDLWRQWGFDGERWPDWLGADCTNGKQVQQKVRDGWPEGRDRLVELRDKVNISLPPIDRRRRMTRTDRGDSLDIHAVYAGRLDIAWRVAKRRSTIGPQKIEVAANMLCAGAEHSDVLFWRGAAATVLADMLEAAGFSVRLVIIFGGVNSTTGTEVSCRITVKDHGAPLDISTTAVVTMPGFFRALGHAWIASHMPGRQSDSGISVRQGITEPSEILVSHNVRDHGTASAFLEATVAKLNSGAMENQVA